jgi:hypothetical protein
MLSNRDVKYLREVAIPNLKAMKKSTRECIKKLEELKRKRLAAQ